MQVNKIAVIGLGSIGDRHCKNLLGLGYNVIGYDPDQSKVDNQKGNDHFTGASNEREALSMADAAIIATPHYLHADSLKRCVELKKHCMIEKPLSTSLNEVQDLVRSASQDNLVVMCAFNLRHRPVVVKAKEILPKLGKLYWARFTCATYLPHWRPHQNYKNNYTNDAQHGGIIFDIAHEFDLATFLMDNANVVAAYAENSGLLDIEAEDRASVTLKHASGAISHIYLDYITQPKERNFQIVGEHGVLKVDLQSHELKLIDTDGQVLAHETHCPDDNDFEYISEIKGFIDAIENKQCSLDNSSNGVDNLRLLLDARKVSNLP